MSEADIVDKAPQQGLARQVPRTFSLMPASLGEAMEIANLIAQSDFAPKDYVGKPANVMIAIQMGADVGLKPMQALQNIAVINGRPSIWGDAALALAQNRGVLERFHETTEGDGEAYTAVCIIKRAGLPDEIRRTFSVADAKKADLWTKKGPWQTYPKRMLQMRARAFALRDAAADCLMGLGIAEEVMDFPDAIDVTATTVQDALPANPLDNASEGLRESIEKAFETLSLSPALRATKINEFFGAKDVRPDEAALNLLEWCKDEYSKRKTGQPRKKSNDDNGKKVQAVTEGTPEGGVAGSAVAPAAGASVSAPSVQTTPGFQPGRPETAVDPKSGASDVRPAGAEAPSGGSGPVAPPSKRALFDEAVEF